MDSELAEGMKVSPARSADSGTLKLSDLVYAKISGKIQSGEYPIDSRLPTENELAEWLGVSRPVVREALARLRNDGVVVSRRGSGTYVQKIQMAGESSHPPLTSIADMRRCLEFRISVESEAAWHAANGREEDRNILREAFHILEKDLLDNVIVPENDFGFHLSVAIATGNRFFSETMINLRSSVVTAMAITPNFIQARSTDRLTIIFDEHKAIYEAVIANDAEGAKVAMRRHLTRAMNRVFDGVA